VEASNTDIEGTASAHVSRADQAQELPPTDSVSGGGKATAGSGSPDKGRFTVAQLADYSIVMYWSRNTVGLKSKSTGQQQLSIKINGVNMREIHDIMVQVVGGLFFI
jgi:hypothetical protein